MVTMKGDFKIFILIFVGSIVTAALIGSIATSIVGQTNTITVTNLTVTAATNNTALNIEGRQLLTTVAITNASNGTQSLVNNGAILQTGVGSGGLLSVQLLLNNTASAYSGQSVNVSYTANPDGYISSSGARTITRSIIIFGALAILVFVIIMLMKGSLSDFVKFGRYR